VPIDGAMRHRQADSRRSTYGQGQTNRPILRSSR
jgi:hypothetical protein